VKSFILRCLSRFRPSSSQRTTVLKVSTLDPLRMTSLQQDELVDKSQSDCQDDEPSRDGALRSLLIREDLSDVTLRASDGTLVLANRNILASRSSVFFGMLYGPFKEASNSVVDVGYEGKVLQAIVSYIYTDKLSACNANASSQEEKADDTDDAYKMKLVRFLVAMMDASDYFALSALRRKTESSAKELMLARETFAPFFMAECAPDCDATKVLRDTALLLVKKNPTLLIHGTKSIVAQIHPSYVQEILKQERLPMNEYSCFQILQAWATAETGSPEGENNVAITASTEATTHDWQTNRKRVASEMSSYIHPENISPTDLSTVVASSDLVSVEQLFDAYKTQALRSEKSGIQMRTFYEQCRGVYVWIQSGTNTVVGDVVVETSYDVLDCPIMKSGVHKWRVQVGEGEGYELAVLAVSLLRSDVDGYYEQHKSWVLTGGEALHYPADGDESQVSGPPFAIMAGSIVSFSLDLERGGILTVTIDGSAPFEAFSGMCQGNSEDEGFLPAVNVWDGDVKFLGFEQDGVYF
jgi:hypothetical protein